MNIELFHCMFEIKFEFEFEFEPNLTQTITLTYRLLPTYVGLLIILRKPHPTLITRSSGMV